MSILKDTKIIGALRCPVCKEKVWIEEKGSGVMRCYGEKRHCYDLAASGYVNMSNSSKSNTGDAKQAVRARSAFLDTGHYEPVAKKTCELLKRYIPEGALVIDAGCGEGYYSDLVASEGYLTLGFDLSKFAVDAAAKRSKRAGNINTFYGVASVFSMPISDNVANAVINIFAPCVEAEYSRVLDDNGVLIVVHAGPEHLLGLKTAIYAQAHENETRADLPKEMHKIDELRLKYDIDVNGAENIQNLFAMTPYYWKTSKEDVEKLNGLERLNTKIDMIFSVYKKQAL